MRRVDGARASTAILMPRTAAAHAPVKPRMRSWMSADAASRDTAIFEGASAAYKLTASASFVPLVTRLAGIPRNRPVPSIAWVNGRDSGNRGSYP